MLGRAGAWSPSGAWASPSGAWAAPRGPETSVERRANGLAGLFGWATAGAGAPSHGNIAVANQCQQSSPYPDLARHQSRHAVFKLVSNWVTYRAGPGEAVFVPAAKCTRNCALVMRLRVPGGRRPGLLPARPEVTYDSPLQVATKDPGGETRCTLRGLEVGAGRGMTRPLAGAPSLEQGPSPLKPGRRPRLNGPGPFDARNRKGQEGRPGQATAESRSRRGSERTVRAVAMEREWGSASARARRSTTRRSRTTRADDRRRDGIPPAPLEPKRPTSRTP
jgi:hypothetical protein